MLMESLWVFTELELVSRAACTSLWNVWSKPSSLQWFWIRLKETSSLWKARSVEHHIALIYHKLFHMEFVYSRTKVLPFVEKATGPPMNSVLPLMKRISTAVPTVVVQLPWSNKHMHVRLLPQTLTLLWESVSHMHSSHTRRKSHSLVHVYATSLWIPSKAPRRKKIKIKYF